jgi:hypothetical protein
MLYHSHRAVLYLKLYDFKERDVTYFVLKEKEGKEIKVQKE